MVLSDSNLAFIGLVSAQATVIGVWLGVKTLWDSQRETDRLKTALYASLFAMEAAGFITLQRGKGGRGIVGEGGDLLGWSTKDTDEGHTMFVNAHPARSRWVKVRWITVAVVLLGTAILSDWSLTH